MAQPAALDQPPGAPPRAAARTSRPPALAALLIAAVLLMGAASPAGGLDSAHVWTPVVAAGPALVSFRDARLEDLYGRPAAASMRMDLRQMGPVRLSAGLALACRSRSSGPHAYVQSSAGTIYFLPIHLQLSRVQPLLPGLALRAGPRVAWAWFREEWSAHVPQADLTARHRAAGSWFAAGAEAALILSLGRGGKLHAGLDWMWAAAERAAVPGDDLRSGKMTGGWSLWQLAWEPPWQP